MPVYGSCSVKLAFYQLRAAAGYHARIRLYRYMIIYHRKRIVFYYVHTRAHNGAGSASNLFPDRNTISSLRVLLSSGRPERGVSPCDGTTVAGVGVGYGDEHRVCPSCRRPSAAAAAAV